MTKLVVQVPATTANLGPGFDALGMALNVWNRFEFTLSGSPIDDVEDAQLHVSCTGEGADEIPIDATNLVFRAFRAGLAFVSRPMLRERLEIVIHNRVPLSSGLGSSATAIVGGLAAARALGGGEDAMSDRRLIHKASELEGHPDNVAPAVLGGFVVSATEKSGHIQSVTIVPPRELSVCLAVPDFYLTTDQSRSHLPERVSRMDTVFTLSRASLWVAAMATGRLDVLRVATEDVLHQPYRAALIPGLEDVFASAREAGALGVCLSGAGPSVAAFCTADHAAHVGEAMRHTFKKVGVTARIVTTSPSNSGVQVWTNSDFGADCVQSPAVD